jgi:hypothetical protein
MTFPGVALRLPQAVELNAFGVDESRSENLNHGLHG